MIKDLAFVEGGSDPTNLVAAENGDRIYFTAQEDPFRHTLWTSSPEGGTYAISVDDGCNARASHLWTVPLADQVFVAEFNGASSPTETLSVADADGGNLRPIASFESNGLGNGHAGVALGDVIVFAVRDPDIGHLRLWSSDGTTAGTAALTPPNFDAEPDWSEINGRMVVRDRHGFVWTTDGTVIGTQPLDDRDGLPVQSLAPSVRFDAYLYFGHFRTDGTPAGTGPVEALSDLDPRPHVWAATDDRVFFIERSPVGTTTIFSLDAQENRTRVARLPALVREPITTRHTLFFEHDSQLWSTDGTPASTVPLLLFPPGARLDAAEAMATAEQLFFYTQGLPGLWRSDGTVEGTINLSSTLTPSLGPLEALAIGDTLVFGGRTTERDLELWRSDGTLEGTYQVADIEGGDEGSFPTNLTRAGDTLYFAASTTDVGRELWAVPLDVVAAQPLVLTANGRFELTVQWTKPNGETGSGHPVRLTEDTGFFWFFNESNVELMVKILDGRNNNGHFWVFYGALSNVAYTLEVRDTMTGTIKTYDNPVGTFASRGDTEAFPAAPDALNGAITSLPSNPRPFATPKGSPTCASTNDALCLQQQRFRVEVTWQDSTGAVARGTAVPLSADTGYFWFGRETNVELMVKVLDGRNSNGHFWVFYGALSNLAYTITVTDTQTGAVKVYDNPRGTFGSRGDTQAFSGNS